MCINRDTDNGKSGDVILISHSYLQSCEK